MSTGVIIVVVVAVVVLAALAAALLRPGRRSRRLQEQFGPEYDRVVAQHNGNNRAAEQELQERVKRVEQLDIRPLDAAQREHYLADWSGLQEQFVDEPAKSLSEADQLLAGVLRDRGYPDDDPYTALSVHHSGALAGYRNSRSAANRARQGEGTTEELRQSFVELRGAFEALVSEGPKNQRIPVQRTAPALRQSQTTEESA
ncbi:hypothetical protein [Streptacidiphilus sp. P02-A3a]|uniref:hypothetical protein n=1 Tax=Streptacidiphilus sp. P02-A3a TaxID=2704468 RepID=UPI0015F8949A|nr:hypothetical protein [Streptacidiphilus sp. P02-A3a]